MPELDSLYTALSKDAKYDIGEKDYFVDKYSDAANLQRLYGILAADDNYDVGDWEYFNDKYGVKKKEPRLVSAAKNILSDLKDVGKNIISNQSIPQDGPQAPSDRDIAPQDATGVSKPIVEPLDKEKIKPQFEHELEVGKTTPTMDVNEYLQTRKITEEEYEHPDFKGMLQREGKLSQNNVDASDIILENVRTGRRVREGRAEEVPAIKAWVDKYPFMAPLVNFEQGVGRETSRIAMNTIGGAQKMFYKGIGSLMQVSPIPAIKDAGAKLKKQQDETRNWFQQADDYVQKSFDENWPEAQKDDAASRLVYSMGSLTPFIGSMALTPQIGLKGISMQLPVNFAAQNTFQTYEETGDLAQSLKEGAMGVGEGLAFTALGYGSMKGSQGLMNKLTGKLSPRTTGTLGATTTATAMAGGGYAHDVASQIVEHMESGSDEPFKIDRQRAADASLMWFSFGVPGMLNAATHSFTKAPQETLNMARNLRVDVDALRNNAVELEKEAAKETKDVDQAEKLVAASQMHKMADIKAIDQLVAKDPDAAMRMVNESRMSDLEKQDAIARIEESVMHKDMTERFDKEASEQLKEKGDGKVPKEGESVLKEPSDVSKEKITPTEETISGKPMKTPEGAEIMLEGMVTPEEKALKKQEKIKEDAIQEPVAEKVDVEEQPEVSKEVREGDAEAPKEEVARKEDVEPPKPPVKPPVEKTAEEAPDEKPDHISRFEKIHKQREDYEKSVRTRAGRKKLVDVISEATLDKESHIKRLLDKVGTKESARAVRDINLRHGATSSAASAIQRARSRIFGDPLLKGSRKQLNKKEQALLNDAVSVMRTIEIEESRNKKRNAIVKEMVSREMTEQGVKKEQIADFIEKKITEDITREEIMDRINKEFGDAVDTKKMDAIWEKAEKESPSLKHEGGLTVEEAYARLEAIKEKDPETLAQHGLEDVDTEMLKKRADAYYDTLGESLKEQYEAGIIDKESYEWMKKEYPYYSPRMQAKYANTVDKGGGISGVKALTTGSEAAMDVGMDQLLQDNIRRSRSMAANNRMMNSLADFAKASPDNGFVKVAKEKAKKGVKELPETTSTELAEYGNAFREKQQKNATVEFEDAPDNMVAHDYYEDGVKKQLWIDKEVYDPLFPGDKYDKLHQVTNIAGWAVGTPILRAAATGYNPEFAVKNIPIDALHQWMTTQEYSPIMPKAIAQIRSDMKAVRKDAMLRKGRYLDFIQEGGGMEFLSDQGKLQPQELGKAYSGTKANVKEAVDAMGYIGNSSEILMRLGLRERALKNGVERFKKEEGRDPNKQEMKELQRDATAVARGYIDFSQGGYITKAANNMIPYLNAGTQVMATSARAIKKNPKLWAAKAGQIAGVAAGITAWNMGNYSGGDEEQKEKRREAYLNNISNAVKGKNLVIMTNVSYKDKNGKERFVYLRIPLDAGVHPIKNLAEDMMIKTANGDAYKDHKLLSEKQFEGLKEITRNFTDVSSLPPVLRGLYGAKSNYDSYYNQPIWVGPEYGKNKDQEFYADYTPERFVALGKKTGMSPVRSQYFAKQIFTGSNLFASAMGEGFDKLALAADPELRENTNKETAKTLANTPFVRRFAKLTSPYTQDEQKEVAGKRARMKTINNRKMDEILDSDLSEDDKGDAIIGLLEATMQFDMNEAKRISDRYHMKMTNQDISGNMFSWLMMERDPSVRAELYHLKTKNMAIDELEAMDESIAEIKGLQTQSFMTRLLELREQEQQNEQEKEND
jgi:predicted transcriptional regulator with HTH domain